MDERAHEILGRDGACLEDHLALVDNIVGVPVLVERRAELPEVADDVVARSLPALERDGPDHVLELTNRAARLLDEVGDVTRRLEPGEQRHHRLAATMERGLVGWNPE